MKKDLTIHEGKKKCNVMTCIHYAGGYCLSFGHADCDMFERHYIQEG